MYERWLRFEELPKFMKSLGKVERSDDTHFSFCNIRDGKEQRGVFNLYIVRKAVMKITLPIIIAAP